jgi:DNA polymerase-3 subunit gamma/tau
MENGEAGFYKIDLEKEALEYIAKLADGGMRDAITLLDKCISYSTDVSLKNVVEALGTVNYDFMFDLTNAVYAMQAAEVIQYIEQLHRSGADLKPFIKQYTLFVLDLCKYDLLRNFEYLQIPSIFSMRVEKFQDDAFNFFHTLLNSMIKLSADIKWET